MLPVNSSGVKVMGHFEFMFIIEASFLSPSRVAAARRVPDSGIPRAPSRPDARE